MLTTQTLGDRLESTAHPPFPMTKVRAILLGFLFVTVIGALDLAAGFRISLFVLNIIPVMFVTWFASPRWGVFFAVLMSVVSLTTDIWLAPSAQIFAHYRYLDIGSDFAATLLLVYMQHRLRKAYDQAMHSSRTDALTGCLNKSGFVEELVVEIERSKRYGHPMSLIYVDCDNFKTVNDTLGHQAGDAVLADIGRVLRKRIRSVDSAGRLGGDEFAVLLRESSAEAALSLAQQIKLALDRGMHAHQRPVSFSIGAAAFDKPPHNADAALKAADAVMYEVKKHGKDDVRVRRC
ncbi:GGDEF domain-containing protein [Noviherbaspirillum sp. ST9]|uniref:GGDEF domain-containing protein n=1 Tax=Noviherbaspirillum sp. ST9 TaxID=3401606 RepID=UPI003B589A77